MTNKERVNELLTSYGYGNDIEVFTNGNGFTCHKGWSDCRKFSMTIPEIGEKWEQDSDGRRLEMPTFANQAKANERISDALVQLDVLMQNVEDESSLEGEHKEHFFSGQRMVVSELKNAISAV